MAQAIDWLQRILWLVGRRTSGRGHGRILLTALLVAVLLLSGDPRLPAAAQVAPRLPTEANVLPQRIGTLPAAARLPEPAPAAVAPATRLQPAPPPAAVTDYPLIVAADGPAGYWRLGEASGQVADSSGNNHTSTSVSGLTYGAPGAIAGDSNTALENGGATVPDVTIPSSTALGPSAALSLEAWVRLNSVPGVVNGTNKIIFKDQAYVLQQTSCLICGSFFTFGVYSNGQWVFTPINPFPYTAGQWYHLVGTYDGTALNLYANGAFVVSQTLTTTVNVNSNPVHLFSDGAGGAPWDGRIDEAAVYRHALAAQQVKQHYDAGKHGTGLRLDTVLAGLVDTLKHNLPFLFGRAGGDPVHTFTGSFGYSHTDLALAGHGPTPAFARTYNSNDPRVGPLGPGWAHNYRIELVDPGDGTGDVILVGPQGRADRYRTNGDGSYTAPDGVLTTLTKHADGTYTASHADQSRWRFSIAGQLLAVADRYGNQSTLSYTPDGLLRTIGDPAGRGVVTLTYTTAYSPTRLVSVTDWLSRTVSFGYDGQGRLSTVTDRESKVTSYGYDGTSHRLTTITDANGHVALTNAYDANGRVVSQKDARGLATGETTTFDYTTVPSTTIVTFPPTSAEPTWQPTEEDSYDAQGRLVKRVVRPTSSPADHATVEYGYDAQSNLAWVKDPLGRITDFGYDLDYAGLPISPTQRLLTRRIDPAPAPGAERPVTLYQYDAQQNLIQVVPPQGVSSSASVTLTTNLSGSLNLAYATDYGYDASRTKLLTTTVRATDPEAGRLTAITTYEYDASYPGQLSRIIPPRGNTGSSPDYGYATSFSYHPTTTIQAGLLASVTDPAGNTTSYEYDAAGRRIKLVDPNGHVTGANPAAHTWESSYDAEDRLRFHKAPPPTAGGSPLVTEYRYDAVGNQTVVIAPDGQVTQYHYDERDSLALVLESPSAWTDPAIRPSDVITTAYRYDARGNLTRLVRAQGSADERATEYRFDGADRPVQEIDYPSWPATTPTLSAQLGYDRAGNRTSLTDPNGRTTSFSYDGLNRLTAIDYSDPATADAGFGYDRHGNRVTMTDGTGTTSYRYDERDRLLAVTTTVGTTSTVVGYRYDHDGHRTKLRYPDGTAVSYAFDPAGRLTGLTDWAGRATSYAYDPAGRLTTITHTNGTTTTYTYDHLDRLTALGHQHGATPIGQYGYTLDPLGNRTAVTETTGTTAYRYDRLSRLTQVTRPDARTVAYSYDPVGNRMSKTAAATTSYAYDKVDRLTTAGGVAYSFDNNGNQTGRGSDAFAYDQANRLISVTIGSNTTQFTYDGDGNRASKTYCDCAPERYTYDVNRALPVLLQDGQRTYVWGLGLAYEVTNSGAVLVPHVDGLGSVRALSDGSGAVLQTYETDAFGVPTLVSGPSRQSLRYTGEPYDAETGLVYLRARYYDPQTGRFLSRDSFEGFGGAPQSLNRYSYAQHNPTTLTDPSGHTPTSRALEETPCASFINQVQKGICTLPGQGLPTPWGLALQQGIFDPTILDGLGSGRGGVRKATGGRWGTKTDRIVADHLTPSDLAGAKIERAGGIAKEKALGVRYRHDQEVAEAQQGLLKRIDAIKRALANPNLGPAERKALTSELGEASRRLDWSEKHVGRIPLDEVILR